MFTESLKNLPSFKNVEKRDVGRWLRRGALVILTLITVLLVTSVTYQQIASNRAVTSHTPLGEMINVGDFNLHVNVMGEKSELPTVILEHGGGGFSVQWGWIQPALAEYTQVVSYDRPGIGWSEDSPTPLSAADSIEALRKALNQKGIEGPYILVAHSMGALMSRAYAELHPEEVIGMVLLDPRPLSWEGVFTPEEVAASDIENARQQFQIFNLLNTIGVMRWLGMAESRAVGLPADIYETAVNLHYRNGYMWDMFEDGLLGESAIDLIPADQELGDMPILILSAGTADTDFTAEVRPRFTAAQTKMTTLSSQTQQRILPEATHYTIVTEKTNGSQVVDAVLEVAR